MKSHKSITNKSGVLRGGVKDRGRAFQPGALELTTDIC